MKYTIQQQIETSEKPYEEVVQQEINPEPEPEPEPEWLKSAYMKIVSPKEVKKQFPGMRKLKLNYAGNCSKIFKYPKNSERDLIIYGYSQMDLDKLDSYLYQFGNVLESVKFSTPNAKIIIFVFGETNSKFDNFLKHYGIERINVDIPSGWIAANARMQATYDYLEKHVGEYDRRCFLLNDVFATVSTDEVLLMSECQVYHSGKKGVKECQLVGGTHINRPWLEKSIDDQDFVRSLIKKKLIGINVGVIIGGAKHVKDLFKVVANNMEKHKMHIWGYEQSMLDVMYYTDKLNHIPVVFEDCTQRICFKPFPNQLNMGIDALSLTYIKDRCSPVLIHKGYPYSWEKIAL
ncbi:Uncharacterized protein QTN25_001836 [Entamoeba marina]